MALILLISWSRGYLRDFSLISKYKNNNETVLLGNTNTYTNCVLNSKHISPDVDIEKLKKLKITKSDKIRAEWRKKLALKKVTFFKF